MKARTLGRNGTAEVFRAMKNVTVLSLMILTTICLLSGCSSAQQLPANNQQLSGEKKVLIVYLSRTNNTKAVAEFIHQKVGGMMVALELETPYPADYNATVQQVARENETGFLPPLKTRLDRIEQYDFVFLGFPTWGMQLPPPVKSFLRQYSLKGKTVIPFNTNAGYGEGSSFQTVRELCLQSTVLEGFVTGGGLERDGQYLGYQVPRQKSEERNENNYMKVSLLGLCFLNSDCARGRRAAKTRRSTCQDSPECGTRIVSLSSDKWRWMSERKVDSLAALFHDEAVFVHMGGTMSKTQELDVIRSGGIQYKNVEIQEVSVRFIGATVVTEVYVRQSGAWKLGSLSFTRLLGP